MKRTDTRRGFLAGAAALMAATVAKCGRAVGPDKGASAAWNQELMPPEADALSAGMATTVYTHDSQARLLAVTHPGGAATTFTYPNG